VSIAASPSRPPANTVEPSTASAITPNPPVTSGAKSVSAPVVVSNAAR
jgi:hypothetical protein